MWTRPLRKANCLINELEGDQYLVKEDVTDVVKKGTGLENVPITVTHPLLEAASSQLFQWIQISIPGERVVSSRILRAVVPDTRGVPIRGPDQGHDQSPDRGLQSPVQDTLALHDAPHDAPHAVPHAAPHASDRALTHVLLLDQGTREDALARRGTEETRTKDRRMLATVVPVKLHLIKQLLCPCHHLLLKKKEIDNEEARLPLDAIIDL